MATAAGKNKMADMEDLDSQVRAAKAFLLQQSTDSKENLYDHLAGCLSRVLEERPNNAVDIFENLSLSVKKEQYRAPEDTLGERDPPSERVEVAEKQTALYERDEGEEGDMDEEVAIPFPNLMEVAGALEQGGVGLGREENFRILLALRALLRENTTLQSVRFWGKVFGTKRDYIIAEAEFQEGEGEEEEQEEGEGEEEGLPEDGGEEEEEEEGEGEEGEEKPKPPPKSTWKPPATVPSERPKTGANKKTYFVCYQPGEPWQKLPRVSPAQISTARVICKLFTGDLDAEVVTFPPFPGTERNYLRAQVARITASTQISPTNYFTTGDEEEEEEPEEGVAVETQLNEEFEMQKISDYVDPENWVHHVPYILPQGRTVWWNPSQKADDELVEDEEEDEEEEKEQPEEPEPETGPSLLSAISADEKVNGFPAWSLRLTSNLVPQYASALVSSNLWPGAHALAYKKTFDNVYIGWGLKYSAVPFNPQLPPPMQEEFPAGADITETTDPTVEQEEALRKAQEEATEAMEGEEEPEESDED